MSNQKIELVDWESVRRDCKFPITDNNDDFIYGMYLIDIKGEGDIIDIQWFKTTAEREDYIDLYHYELIDCY